MTQSAMCIPLWPAGTAILRIWSCALSLAAAVARFATGKLSNWLIARFLW